MNHASFLISAAFLLVVSLLAAPATATVTVHDLYVSEAFFSAHQKEWFDALVSLETAPGHSGRADKAVIDFELSYRLQARDGKAVLNDIEQLVDDVARNKRLFKLAQLYFRKNRAPEALLVLDRIKGDIQLESRDAVPLLRAQVMMSHNYYGEAINLLSDLMETQSFLGFSGYYQKTQNLIGFSSYNLGVAYLLNNNIEKGRRQLDLAGQITGDDEMTLSIRDQANLVLGEQLLREGLYDQAGLVFDRIRLQGPFSAQALLFAGWWSALQNDCKSALVPWSVLLDHNVADAAVQDAMLAVPYCYGELGVHSNAATHYGRAVDRFEEEIEKLNGALADVREGHFLKRLALDDAVPGDEWQVRLPRHLEDAGTAYLLDLFSTDAFQEALHNYHALEKLRRKLMRWQQDLPAYEEMVARRRAHFEPLLPDVDAEFNRLEPRAQDNFAEHARISKLLGTMKTTPRPDLLATDDERELLKQIDQVDIALGASHVVKTRARIARLRGLLYWQLFANYDRRLEKTISHFEAMNEAVAKLKQQYGRYVVFRRAASESYSGYDGPLTQLSRRIETVLDKITTVMERQGDQVALMAEAELLQRRDTIMKMQVKARFAMADSYDRAVVDQGAGGKR